MMVRAYSSGVEHYVDIVGVPSSNLGTPTIILPKGVAIAAPFCFRVPVHSGADAISASIVGSGVLQTCNNMHLC